MNTQWTTRVRLFAFAAAGAALLGVMAPAFAGQTDNRPVVALNGWNVKTGPGIGSTKMPGGVLFSGTTLFPSHDNTLYFHADNGTAVQQAPTTHTSPGLWSSKSPYSDRLNYR